MKRIYFALAILAIVMVSCHDEESEPETPQPKQSDAELLSKKEIRKIIKSKVQQTGDFIWKEADPNVIWSAAMHGDSILTIGYSDLAYSELRTKSLNKSRSDVIEAVSTTELIQSKKKSSKETDIIVREPEKLNCIDLRVTKPETVKMLCSKETVRYIEPNAFRLFDQNPRQKSSAGCDNTAVEVNPEDYTSIEPGCQVSWTYYKHNIPQAWKISTGSDIGVGLVGTGVSDNQPLLGNDFENGYSDSRSLSKHGVYVDSYWYWSAETDGHHDKCGHGTLMAATIAGPRNNENLPVGVAYNCDFVAYRATENVVLDWYHEKHGVAEAITYLATNDNVQVISISLGHVYSIGVISDAIKYAYDKGKLIVAAGGTSTTWTTWAGVIFPARMDETVAVTGITDDSSIEACDVCHQGSEIDFTVIMQRRFDANRRSVSLGYFDNTRTYVGGSSVATATTAGIAALVWANHPGWSRSQVLQRMRESASFYPSRNDSFGWGAIDAYQAVQ
jgi:subtilisin family serine protease